MKKSSDAGRVQMCQACDVEMTLVTRSARAGETQPSHSFYRCQHCGRVMTVVLSEEQ